MKSIASLFTALLAFLMLAASAVAQDTTRQNSTASNGLATGEEPLVIFKGQLYRDKQTVPATLRNVLDVVRLRYPSANISVLGADDFIIENLKLPWKRMVNEKGEPLRDPPLAGVVRALSIASGEKLHYQEFSPNDFLIHPAGLMDGGHPEIEIFNLSSFFYRGPSRLDLEERIKSMELRRATVEKRYAPQHPKHEEVERLADEIETAKAQLAQSRQPSEEQVKTTVAGIREVVLLTLPKVKPGDKGPEFQFHPGSNLLIVTGSGFAIDVTRKVIAAMERSP
jgi:hypothetical protein